MKKNFFSIGCIAIGCIVAVVGCSNTLPHVADSRQTAATQLLSSHDICQGHGITIDYRFDNARVNDCLINDSRVTLTITPENEPINNSPWYAFRASSESPMQINVLIKYVGGNHRYSPKMSTDGKLWQPIKHKSTKNKLRFSLNTTPAPIFVAGQELVTNQAYHTWMGRHAASSNVRVTSLGKSTNGRDIGMMEITQPTNKEWLVVLGRMHPPEVTGALALFPFVDNMLGGKGAEFINRFNILVIPNVNPDGVAEGHWRHNAKGVDLNRDWKAFKQVESRLIRDKLNAIEADGGNIVFALDFHSTHKDIFYTMPSNYGLHPPHLVEQWLAQLADKIPTFKVRQQPGNNPNKGVFKQYIADTFKVHAITYEMGDSTDRAVINKVAIKANDTLMKQLLATPAVKFNGL